MDTAVKLLNYWEEMTESAHRVLLLQGPIGPFFYDLKRELSNQHQCEVFKINLNGGDEYFYPLDKNTFSYRDSVQNFPAFLQDLMVKHQIDTVICFGNCRIYHKLAKQYCLDHSEGINFWVFEEGYLRPNYITLEKWGVNDYSILDRTSQSYQSAYQELGEPTPAEHVAPGFKPMARLAIAYYLAMQRSSKKFPHYQHHRERHLLRYATAWVTSGWRKVIYKQSEKAFSKRVQNGELNPFFIVPLQVHDDSQVKEHSNIKSVPRFIRKVVASFAKNAPVDTHLILKHHPMDRGFNHYGRLIQSLIKHYHLEGRVFYVFDIPLPVLMRKGQGMVVINSTSGLSAMIHHLPVKVLGYAHYDIEGLTDAQPLDTFWRQPTKPNAALFNAYRLYHLNKTQINGSFYNRVIWPN